MINPEIKIRPASLSDSEQLTALVNSVYRGENSKKGWTTKADLLDGIRITKEKIEQLIGTDSNVILIAEFDNKIIGCVHLEKKKNERCHLGMLSVDVNYQNKGIGKLMMERSEEYSKKDFGCAEMEMKVIGQRKELIDYYLRRGYVLTGEKEPFVLKHHFGQPKRTDLHFRYLVKKLQ